MKRREFMTMAALAAGTAAAALTGTARAEQPPSAGKPATARPAAAGPGAAPAGQPAVAATRGVAGAMTLARWQQLRRHVTLPLGRIAVVEQGSGPAALFLHGFPLNSFQWRDAVAALSAHRRCIAPDFLGLGYTEPAPGQGVAPDDQVAMLVALMDKLGVDQADVLASDSGGAVAQLLLVRHPQRVRSLLLANCDSEPDCPPPKLLPVIAEAREGVFVDRSLALWAKDHDLARSAQGLHGLCYLHPDAPSDAALDAYLLPLVSSPARKALVHAYAIALDHNVLAGVSAPLKQSKVPARVVWGLADDIFFTGAPAHFEQAFGNGRGVRRLDGYKLFWPEERPDVVVEEALALWGVQA